MAKDVVIVVGLYLTALVIDEANGAGLLLPMLAFFPSDGRLPCFLSTDCHILSDVLVCPGKARMNAILVLCYLITFNLSTQLHVISTVHASVNK